MTVKPVLMLGNPQLRETSSEVTLDDPELQNDFTDLRDTLTHLQETKLIGRALSAPQIGIQKRILYLQMPLNTFFMLNPEIIEKSEETQEVWDSCYSFDVAFFVRVTRHQSIKMRYQDVEGTPVEKELDGDMAELIQHEIDHMNGILATDLLRGPKGIIMRDEWEKRFGSDFRFHPMK